MTISNIYGKKTNQSKPVEISPSHPTIKQDDKEFKVPTFDYVKKIEQLTKDVSEKMRKIEQMAALLNQATQNIEKMEQRLKAIESNGVRIRQHVNRQGSKIHVLEQDLDQKIDRRD